MSEESTKTTSDQSSAAPPGGVLARVDAWVAEHPGHPRALPFLVYLVFLCVQTYLVLPYAPALWPLVCGLQSAAVLGLLWRYRRLMPELTLRCHWLAVPVAVAVAAMWVAVGLWMVRAFPQPPDAAASEHYFALMSPALRYASLALELLGIAIVVPLLEEPFVRSFVLRALHRFRPTLLAGAQIVRDLPVLGPLLMRTSLGREADQAGRVLVVQFEATPVGQLSIFGVVVSTLVFVSYHVPRDWPAAVVCGVAYCLLLAATRRHGLGPIIWAHGITNAALFAYSAQSGDWQFL